MTGLAIVVKLASMLTIVVIRLVVIVVVVGRFDSVFLRGGFYGWGSEGFRELYLWLGR